MAVAMHSARGSGNNSDQRNIGIQIAIPFFYFVCNVYNLVNVFTYWKYVMKYHYHKTYVFIGIGIASILTASLIFWLVKKLCQKCFKELSGLKKCKMELLIGYSGMSICGYVISVSAIIFQKHHFLLLIAFISFISSIIIWFLFIAEHLLNYEVLGPEPRGRRNYFAVVFFIVGLAECFLTTHFFGSFSKHNPAVFVGSICFLLVKTELVSIIFNGVLLENTSRISDPVNYSSNASDCNICLLQYSNLVIPRILIGCGHTFCEICIRKLPRTLERVSCPLCRNITLLPCGRPDLLPKNYTVMDMIQERNL
ncbi:hypothetical protein CAEBREN_00044 [Caenorhabditis brenneri]|uniref:RING-type domain-containing protein n=1 Tax=Caenorhabditis brenneri TaxID=135651 RepID=G0N7Z4_CAEBE|nr:hypothetical protein CAEBREN_00044 [Caenorhabditis brenneri]